METPFSLCVSAPVAGAKTASRDKCQPADVHAAFDIPAPVRGSRRVAKLAKPGGVQIGEPPFRAQFCRELELFMELTGTKLWAVGWCSVRNAAFVTRLFGGSSPNLRTVDRVRTWMHAQLRGEQRRAVFGPAAAVGSSATAPSVCPAPAENPRVRT